MKKHILVIGGEGYIGSKLCKWLLPQYDITSIDIGWYSRHNSEIVFDKADITYFDVDMVGLSPSEWEAILYNTSAVILLAGHSSVAMCRAPNIALENSPAWNNNVRNFSKVLEKINQSHNKFGPKIPIIYASSASVYTNAASLSNIPSKEEDINWNEIIPGRVYDKFCYYDQTKTYIDRLAYYHSQVNEMPIIGLRFGTVNGLSPHMRSELMLNSMMRSGMAEKKIIVTQPELNRSILDINDLCYAIDRILDKILAHKELNYSGIYNLASYSATVQELAEAVRRELGNDVVIDHQMAENPSVYNFIMDTSLFTHTFDQRFMATPNSTVYNLAQVMVNQYYTNRNEPKVYP